MRMEGATNGFIRWPFVYEGFLMGFLGASVAFLMEWGLYEAVALKSGKADGIGNNKYRHHEQNRDQGYAYYRSHVSDGNKAP